MPVKIGIPAGFSGGLLREIENPAYATAVGLVYQGLKHSDRAPDESPTEKKEGGGSMSRMARIMKDWFDQL
jgi:cell division ATPase FtsA